MKIIIAGGREFSDYNVLTRVVSRVLENIDSPEIVSGCARGADSLGSRYAIENNIPLHKYPADWENLGKKAGYIRNKQMSEVADLLIAFWDGESRGTGHMIQIMLDIHKPVIVSTYHGVIVSSSFDKCKCDI